MESISNASMKTGFVLAIPERCTGCRLCEMVCSLAKQNAINPSLASIQVMSAMAGEQEMHFPIKCDQCLDAPCIDACNRNALYRDRKTGAIIVDKWACNQCGACVAACPFGMISMGEKSIVKCDLCKGEPLCVAVCKAGALKFVQRDMVSNELSLRVCA